MASQGAYATFPGAHNEGSQVGQNQEAIYNYYGASVRVGTSLVCANSKDPQIAIEPPPKPSSNP
jgi:hypothetical protein